jgi:N4-gp56 family major capsid protein
MATATYPGAAGNTAKTEAATFIPEIWSDEIIAAYQKNLKMAPLVKRLAMSGKKGDKIHIPKPVRGDANAKAADTAVTIIANTEGELTVDIDRHFEYSRLIEDIVEVQALSSLRQFYTEDAGYALAVKVDTDLMNAGTGFGDGTRTQSPANTGADWVNSNSYYFNASSGLAAYAVDTVTSGDNFTDLGFREAIKLMDDANVPMDGRVIVVPPAVRKSIMGIDRYVSSDFVGGRGVESGLIGNLYGVDVYVSSNCSELCFFS